ncbi:MAG: hypothetical protein KKF14_11075 [Alphaproteobacteria bacterium]|nr:hypothetical protein [Alphaproteobacteria bacterium]
MTENQQPRAAWEHALDRFLAPLQAWMQSIDDKAASKPDTRCAADRLAGEILANWPDVTVHYATYGSEYSRKCEILFRGQVIKISSEQYRSNYLDLKTVEPEFLSDMRNREREAIYARARKDVLAEQEAEREAKAAALLVGLTKGAA